MLDDHQMCVVFVKVDERALRDIMEMGFNREAARQALLDNNNNVEVALNSLLTGTNQLMTGQTEQSRPPPRGQVTRLLFYIQYSTLILHQVRRDTATCLILKENSAQKYNNNLYFKI